MIDTGSQFTINLREAAGPFVLSLDIGSSSVRALLFDAAGRSIDHVSGRVEREFVTTRDGGSEADATGLLKDIETAIDDALAECATVKIDFLAISCFWHSLLGVDSQFRPVTKIIGWSDTRAAAQALQLKHDLDESLVHTRTGCRFHPGYWPAKLLWLKSTNDYAARVATWIAPGDLVLQTFCGEGATSISMASGTGLLNQHTCNWDEAMLDHLSITPAALPRIAPRGESFQLIEAYAARWPQLRDARVFPALGDGAANNLGSGCTTNCRVGLMIGTSGAMRVTGGSQPPEQLPGGIWCYRIDAQRTLIGGALSDGGGLYAWMGDALSLPATGDALEDQIAALGPDAHGLTLLPFWAGERSTGWSPIASGVIAGLKQHTQPIEIVRASMEAIAFRFALLFDQLKQFATAPTIYASGGAVRDSGVWFQILTDVLGQPLRRSTINEASSRGVALLALEVAGVLSDLAEIEAPFQETRTPDLACHEVYRKAIARQQALYEKLGF